jgi:hypothetical protein
MYVKPVNPVLFSLIWRPVPQRPAFAGIAGSHHALARKRSPPKHSNPLEAIVPGPARLGGPCKISQRQNKPCSGIRWFCSVAWWGFPLIWGKCCKPGLNCWIILIWRPIWPDKRQNWPATKKTISLCGCFAASKPCKNTGQTGQTPFYGFYSMRLLHLLTNQRSSSLWGYLAALFLPPNTQPLAEELIVTPAFSGWLKELQSSAYGIFPNRLKGTTVAAIRQFAETTPCTPSYHDREVYDRLTGQQLVEPLIFDPAAPVARRSNFTPAQIVQLPEVQALMAHADLWATARAYLQAEPQLVLVSLWWSSDFQGPHSRYTGQVWHIDIDRFRFLNCFVYLSDVGPENGPHEYVSASQGTKPLPLSVDKRMEPEELTAFYPPERFVEILRPCGHRLYGRYPCLSPGATPGEGGALDVTTRLCHRPLW